MLLTTIVVVGIAAAFLAAVAYDVHRSRRNSRANSAPTITELYLLHNRIDQDHHNHRLETILQEINNR